MGKKRNGKGRVTVTAVTAAILIASVLPAHAELQLGELGKEPNQISSEAAGFTGTQDAVALDDLGISVIPSDYVSIQQEDGFVYIYTKETGCIPYVIVGCYDGTADDFISQFTQYMTQQYTDLQVISPETTVTLGEKEFGYIQYSYEVSGYTVRDSRLFSAANGKTYMFGAKEIPELSFYVGSNLEETAGSFAYLAGGDSDYAKHVDSTRSVESDSQETGTDLEDTVGNIVNQGSGNTDISGTTTGDIGAGGGSSGKAGTTGADTTDTDGGEAGSIVFDQTKADFKGVWVPFEDGFQLYLPEAWSTYELTQEQVSQGVLYLAGDASGADTAPAVSVVWANNDGATTINDLASAIREAGYQVDDLVSINGIPCVSYRVEDGDCCAVMFFHPTNPQYIFCITATQYTANVDMICSILTSLSLAS